MVLVVDDDEGVREALHLILEEEYDIVDAPDGSRAIVTVQSRVIDVVLLDILMPGVDGLEVLQELKANDPTIPVIMMTAVKTIRTTVAAMKLGAFDYVTKPFQETELLRIIRGALEPRRQRRSTDVVPVQRSSKSWRLTHTHRILIVDRDQGRRATLAAILNRFGIISTPPASATARENSGGTLSLCVVLGPDRGRPGFMEIVRFLSTRSPVCPIIAALDSEDPESIRELEALGAQEILRPPYDVVDVVQRVDSILTQVSGPRNWPARPSNSVCRTITHVQAKYGEKLSVKSIAAAVGVSGSHLAHVFRVEAGMTVMDFVTSVRIEIAKHLLATTACSLDRIAAQAGFFDASHLSRVFLQATGRRPGMRRGPRCKGLPHGTGLSRV